MSSHPPALAASAVAVSALAGRAAVQAAPAYAWPTGSRRPDGGYDYASFDPSTGGSMSAGPTG